LFVDELGKRAADVNPLLKEIDDIFKIAGGLILITTHLADIRAKLLANHPHQQLVGPLDMSLSEEEAVFFMRHHLNLQHSAVDTHANRWLIPLINEHCKVQGSFLPRRMLYVAESIKHHAALESSSFGTQPVTDPPVQTFVSC
jgi:hypothetical protein